MELLRTYELTELAICRLFTELMGVNRELFYTDLDGNVIPFNLILLLMTKRSLYIGPEWYFFFLSERDALFSTKSYNFK